LLPSTIFPIYICDLPQTASRKFTYVDGICYATQARSFRELEDTTLTNDMTAVLNTVEIGDFDPTYQKHSGVFAQWFCFN